VLVDACVPNLARRIVAGITRLDDLPMEIILERFYEHLVDGDAIAPLQPRRFQDLLHVLPRLRVRDEPDCDSILVCRRSEVVSLQRTFSPALARTPPLVLDD
jgi:hypothetical protein